MKLLALLTPCAMLAVLWGLQRLETWMEDASGPRGHAGRRPAIRHATEPARSRVKGVSGG